MKRTILVCLLTWGVLVHADEVVVVPGVSLPKRLEWGMSDARCKAVLQNQGIAMPDPKPLLAPEWFGATGWSSSETKWWSAGGRACEVAVRLFFDPKRSLQSVVVVARFRRFYANDPDAASVYASSAHAVLNRKYKPCSPSSVRGHRCSWSDELGYSVVFQFQVRRQDSDDDSNVTISYVAPRFREAQADTDEF